MQALLFRPNPLAVSPLAQHLQESLLTGFDEERRIKVFCSDSKILGVTEDLAKLQLVKFLL